MKTCWIALLLAALLVPGCYHYRIHNRTVLTKVGGPPRNNLAGDQGGLYAIEIKFETNQTNIKQKTYEAYVKVNGDDTKYPMKRLRGREKANLWETNIMVPPDKEVVEYRIHMSWQYNAVPIPKRNSIRSRIYKLFINQPGNP